MGAGKTVSLFVSLSLGPRKSDYIYELQAKETKKKGWRESRSLYGYNPLQCAAVSNVQQAVNNKSRSGEEKKKRRKKNIYIYIRARTNSYRLTANGTKLLDQLKMSIIMYIQYILPETTPHSAPLCQTLLKRLQFDPHSET